MRVRHLSLQPRLGASHANLHRGRSLHSLSPGFARHRYEPAPDLEHDRAAEAEYLLWAVFGDCDDYTDPYDIHKTWVSQEWMSLTFGLLGDRVQWRKVPALESPDSAVHSDRPAAAVNPRVPADRLAAELASRGLPRQGLGSGGVKLAADDRRFFVDLARLCDGQFVDHSVRAAVLTLASLSPFFVREPSSWHNPGGDARSWLGCLADHLLVLYPVPDVVRRAWLEELCFPPAGGQAVTTLVHTWFLLLAQGASIHRAAPEFGWRIPSGLVGWLFRVPAGVTLKDALLWIEVMRRGGTERDFRRVDEWCRGRLTVTAVVRNGGSTEAVRTTKFVGETIGWLVRHGDCLDDDACEMVLAWVEPARKGAGGDFSWSGRGLRATLALAQAYRDSRTQAYRGYRWEPHGWDWSTEHGDVSWSFREITNGPALFEEGQAMRHCVASYADDCARGGVVIVSARRNGRRRLTIAVDPSGTRIAQASGRCNRPLTEEDSALVSWWLRSIREDSARHQSGAETENAVE